MLRSATTINCELMGSLDLVGALSMPGLWTTVLNTPGAKIATRVLLCRERPARYEPYLRTAWHRRR
ncbi:hypothetical protein AGR7B_Lc50362 [Agrobacterium deltaense RV3]|nr:hypothetical protein AGR7B_Lc50362 [Agrobacterium deltaense RV3]